MSFNDDTAVPLPGDWEQAYADYRAEHPLEFNDGSPPAWNDWLAAGIEEGARRVLPNWLENFVVGESRIFTDTVGDTNPLTGAQNPTWGEAWRATDDRIFAGWAPGGAPPEVPQLLQDVGKWGLLAAVALAAFFGLRRR